MRFFAVGLLVCLVIASTYVVVAFRSDMQRAQERIGGHAVVAPSPADPPGDASPSRPDAGDARRDTILPANPGGNSPHGGAPA